MVNIDTIYQRVLALANKEQRGYITPQEFNLFADQAQMDIFEQYFYDINQFLRMNGNSDEYADIIDNLQEKITKFETNNTGSGSIVADEVYRLGSIKLTVDGLAREAEEVQENELTYILQGSLTKPTLKRPIYVRRASSITVYPENNNFTYTYIRRPAKPNWTYIINGENALYNSTAGDHQDFELHASEESNLVVKILQLAGVSIKDYNITQVAAQEEVKTIQQQKS